MSSSRAPSRSASRARSCGAPAWNAPSCSGSQTEFTEPATRINTEPAAALVPWDEDAAWDAVVDHYALARVTA